MNICRICNNKENNRVIKVREMLRGSRNEFDYLECTVCGCLQLMNIPEAMTGYYDNSSYGSFMHVGRSYIKKKIRAVRNRYSILSKGGVLGFLVNKIAPLPVDYSIIKHHAKIDSKILDVGCGGGAYINDLAEIGFSNVSGIDPFIHKEISYPNGVNVRKLFLEELTDKYDVILSHHSFEHVPNPMKTLESIRCSLNEGGVCLLTMPVAEDLYRLYKESCYLIQAPQHYFLFSIRSFIMLAQECGFVVEAVIRDATSTRDWYLYSEMWGKNIANSEFKMAEINSYLEGAKLNELKHIENKLNNLGLGDNVTFVLRSHLST
jgi:2-polyprenyl-3-methyl-5-hydroxy-6-metoxy-1,4-benzoquinol methylase